MPEADTCSVCERTILAGELPRTYLTHDGEPRTVCDLCRPRAEAAGWTPEGRLSEPMPPNNDRGRSRGRMRKMLERARESAAIAASRPPREEEREGQAAAVAASQPSASSADVDARLATPSRRRSVPQSPERRMRRAFERFNASEHRRMVAGLMRSLGSPSVSAVSSASSPAEVRITVAWELAWYQWEVDIAREGAPLRELAKGDEVGELPEDDRRWNAHANSEGELQVGVAEGGSDA
jgi:hypothetical protein